MIVSMLQEVRTLLLHKLVFVYLYNDSILLHFSALHYNCQFLICPCEYTSHPQGVKLGISRNWSNIKTIKTSNSKVTTTTNGNSKRNNKGNNSKLVAYKCKTMICSRMQPLVNCKPFNNNKNKLLYMLNIAKLTPFSTSSFVLKH
jgi:hypothetical protein